MSTYTYKILFSRHTRDLSLSVDEHLAEGWELQGGLAVSAQGSVQNFYQALVYEDDE